MNWNEIYPKPYLDRLNSDISKNFNHLCPIQENFSLTLQGISRLVMLDRYSQKDKERKTLQVGDIVLTIIKPDPRFPARGVGQIVDKFSDERGISFWVIEIEEEFASNIASDLLINSSSRRILKQSFEIEKPLELFYEQIAWRVAKEIASQETNQEVEENLREKFFHLLIDFKIIPAGRVLHGAGSKNKVTYFNCYVMPYIHDSRRGIADHWKWVMEIMSRGGGVGSNGSTLRPKGALVKSIGGTSSGSVSWLNNLSSLTNLVEQGGSRRGAQMIMLADWHPDIIEFVVAKVQNPHVLTRLMKETQDKWIEQEIRNKLEFVKLSEQEEQIIKFFFANQPDGSNLQFSAWQEKLVQQGQWQVRNPEFLSGANISVCLSDRFMSAVKDDQEWDLVFPDLDSYSSQEKNEYDQEWQEIGDAYEWEKKGYKLKKYHTLKARELWNLIVSCATYSAEPGIFFLDRANKFTNVQGYGQKVVATNPCGEQPLAPYSVCNLSAINLASFVKKNTSEVLWDELKETVKYCVRFQDNIIDASFYFPIKGENDTTLQNQAQGERRIGMGVMGLHDFLIYAGLKYGSPEANLLVNKLFETICLTAYETSIELAREKGSFPFLKDKNNFVEKSAFIQSLSRDIQNKIKEYGLRNSHLLTVAPTGSTGTLVGVSTGLEPYFAFSHYRSGRLGKAIKVDYSIVKEWLRYHPETDANNLPNIFVSAMELTPEEHVDVQCIIQRWIDGSISKTINAPNYYGPKQVNEIYQKLYEKGAKGGTVYVDGSRFFQVLSLEKSDNQFNDWESKDKDECNTCYKGKLVLANGCYTCDHCQNQARCDI